MLFAWLTQVGYLSFDKQQKYHVMSNIANFVSAICICKCRHYAEVLEFRLVLHIVQVWKFLIEVWPRFPLQVHFIIKYTRGRLSVTICRESVVNHDECRHSIVNYRNPYHWLRENYEFKTALGTNRIRGIESAIDHFWYIKIQHGNEAWRTRTMEIEWACLIISFVCALLASISSRILIYRKWLIVSTITWETRQRMLRERRSICVLSP